MSLTDLISKEFVQHFAQWVPDFGAAVIIFVLFLMAGSLFKFVISRFSKTFDPQRAQIIRMLATTAKVVTVLTGAITALGSMGVNVSALVASLGLSGFALSFALKDALSNFLAGMMIFIYQPFKIGDNIIVSGQEGIVQELNLRYVRLHCLDKEVLIPNSSMLTNHIAIKPL